MGLSLNRWLIRNRINKIGRTRGYFLMPSFNVNYTWSGYSDLVLVLNYAASRNFSILNPERLRNISTAFTLCVAWADGNGVVYRYRLNTGVGEVIYSSIPDYANQLIKKNFRLEVWSTPALVAVTTSDIHINTSALGDEDTRIGVDFSLGTATAVSDGFGSTGTVVTQPPQDDLTVWLDYQFGITKVGNVVSAWQDQVSGLVFSQADNTKRPTIDATLSMNGVKFLGTQNLIAQGNALFGDVFLFFTTHIGSAAANNVVLYAIGTNAFDASGYSLYSYCGDGTTNNGCTSVLNINFRRVSLPQIIDAGQSVSNLQTIVRVTPNTSNVGQSLLRSYYPDAGTLADQDAPVNAVVTNVATTAGNLILGDSAGVANRGFILASVLCYSGQCPDVAGVMSYFNTCLDIHSMPVPLVFAPSVVVPANV